MPGLRVHSDCYDPKHPQEFLVDVTDPIALWRPAPDSVAFTAPVLSASGLSPIALAWTAADFGAYTVGSYAVYRAVNAGAYELYAGPFENSEDIFQDGNPPISETLSYSDGAVTPGNTYQYYIQSASLVTQPTDNPKIVASNPVVVSL